MQDLTLNFDDKTITNSFLGYKRLIIQKVRLALQCWLGDWFLNPDFGIPYDARLQNKSLLIADIEEIILGVEGVASVQDTSVKTIYKNPTLKQGKSYLISTTVITDAYEEIEMNELIPMIGV